MADHHDIKLLRHDVLQMVQAYLNLYRLAEADKTQILSDVQLLCDEAEKEEISQVAQRHLTRLEQLFKHYSLQTEIVYRVVEMMDAAVEEPAAERVPLHAEVAAICAYFQGLDRHVRLTYHQKDEVFCLISKIGLQRIIFNLVTNSIEAMDNEKQTGINVTVWRGVPEVYEEPRVGKVIDGKEYGVVSIIDEGQGIPQEVRDLIFRVKASSKRGGLGTQVVKSILEKYDGALILETRDDMPGTRIHVLIPTET